MPKKVEQSANFETTLKEFEQIITRIESGELQLEQVFNEFEQGVQLTRQDQKTLQQAEQRVQFLLNYSPDVQLIPFAPERDSL